ncbi:MAG: hypothetical protein DRK00_06110 [Thermoprotei archaeon]|nr:MAG: hypothetical protein DRK00_06110 [Thermoprotei archaeon]
MGERRELLPGLTWRSLLAVLISALIFIPTSTYASLVVGGTLGAVAVFFVTLLVVEVARLMGVELTRQEMLIVYYGAAIGGSTGLLTPLGNIIYRAYFMHSPFAWSVTIRGVPVPLLIPPWLAPPYGSEAYLYRNMFHQAFIPALTVLLTTSGLTFIADLSLAMFFSRVYVEAERLRFPLADIDVAFIDFLYSRDPAKIKVFLIGFVLGTIWASAIYVPYIIFGIVVLPIPLMDLTWALEPVLPGAPLAVSTVFMNYFVGMLIPFVAAGYMLVLSFINMILTSLFATSLTSVFPEWASEYVRGMGYSAIIWRAGVRVWLVPQIGFGLAAAAFMIYKIRGSLFNLLKAIYLRQRAPSSLGFPPDYILLGMFLVATTSSVALFHFLVPEVPLWVPAFMSICYSFLAALYLTAMQGEVGFTVVPQWVWHTLVYLTPYSGYTGFVYTPAIAGMMAPTFSQQVVVAIRNYMKPIDLVKLSVIAFILANIIGLVSLNYFWVVAPIPSAVYPITVYTFPSTAVTDCMIVSRQLRVRPDYILGSAGFAFLLALALNYASRLGLPFSPLGFFLGLLNWTISTTLPTFLGSLLGELIGPRAFKSKEVWNAVKGLLVAGEVVGEGMIMMLGLTLSLISKAVYPWPW